MIDLGAGGSLQLFLCDDEVAVTICVEWRTREYSIFIPLVRSHFPYETHLLSASNPLHAAMLGCFVFF